LHLRAIDFERQVNLPVSFKGLKLDCGYKIDLVVEEEVVVELKAVEKILRQSIRRNCSRTSSCQGRE
jgi:GxxExxY protein